MQDFKYLFLSEIPNDASQKLKMIMKYSDNLHFVFLYSRKWNSFKPFIKRFCLFAFILISFTSCNFGQINNTSSNPDSSSDSESSENFALVITNKCSWNVYIQFIPADNYNSSTYYPYYLIKSGQTRWFKSDKISESIIYNIRVKPDTETTNKNKYYSLGNYSFSGKTVKRLYYNNSGENYYFKVK